MAERAISKLIPTLWGPDLQECRIYEDGLESWYPQKDHSNDRNCLDDIIICKNEKSLKSKVVVALQRNFFFENGWDFYF